MGERNEQHACSDLFCVARLRHVLYKLSDGRSHTHTQHHKIHNTKMHTVKFRRRTEKSCKTHITRYKRDFQAHKSSPGKRFPFCVFASVSSFGEREHALHMRNHFPFVPKRLVLCSADWARKGLSPTNKRVASPPPQHAVKKLKRVEVSGKRRHEALGGC